MTIKASEKPPDKRWCPAYGVSAVLYNVAANRRQPLKGEVGMGGGSSLCLQGLFGDILYYQRYLHANNKRKTYQYSVAVRGGFVFFSSATSISEQYRRWTVSETLEGMRARQQALLHRRPPRGREEGKGS